MVFMTFMQTVGIVLQVPRIKLPPELRELMTALNIFNFNEVFEFGSQHLSGVLIPVILREIFLWPRIKFIVFLEVL